MRMDRSGPAKSLLVLRDGPWWRGPKGLAFEAATAARLHAARHLGIRAPISLIRPSNARSAALARRMDAVLETPDGLLRGIPCHIWRHPDVLSEGAAA